MVGTASLLKSEGSYFGEAGTVLEDNQERVSLLRYMINFLCVVQVLVCLCS